MATVNPNTRLREALKKKETARLGLRAADVTAIKSLLVSIPKVDPVVVSHAVDALMDAADQYKASRPLADTEGRRSTSSIAKARASVAALKKQLVKAQEQLSMLPIDAIAAIGEATGAPVGKMRSDIEQMSQAAQKALDVLTAHPHKAADAARNVLAYQVAVVFTEILKTKPSSTSEKQLKENKSRGGAAYARVLRATLKAASVVNFDPSPLITAGLRLLKDPTLPLTHDLPE